MGLFSSSSSSCGLTEQEAVKSGVRPEDAGRYVALVHRAFDAHDRGDEAGRQDAADAASRIAGGN
jgi:hypothetical protein